MGLAPADEELLERVVAETRRARLCRFFGAGLPGVLGLVVGAAVGNGRVLVGGLLVVAVGLGWQRWRLGWLPRGPRSLFDGRHPLGHVTFSGGVVFTTLRGRRLMLFGDAAASPAFRQALRRGWPEVPQLVSVWPTAGRR